MIAPAMVLSAGDPRVLAGAFMPQFDFGAYNFSKVHVFSSPTLYGTDYNVTLTLSDETSDARYR